MIPWKRFEVIFHNLSFFPISIINSLSNLIKFEEIFINFLISLWIRPLFTIIPLNSRYFHQIGKCGLFFTLDRVQLTTTRSWFVKRRKRRRIQKEMREREQWEGIQNSEKKGDEREEEDRDGGGRERKLLSLSKRNSVRERSFATERQILLLFS